MLTFWLGGPIRFMGLIPGRADTLLVADVPRDSHWDIMEMFIYHSVTLLQRGGILFIEAKLR